MVYGYACIYTALNKVNINELTLTFVESRHPKKLLSYLQEKRELSVEEKLPGIYNISGDILPIQIIDSRRLSAEENLWLKDLDNRLGATDMQHMAKEVDRQGNARRMKAYLDVIARANKGILEEVLRMSDTTLTLDKIFEEAGLTAIWKARGIAEGEARVFNIAQNMVNMGMSFVTVVAATQLDPETVRALYK
jgi:hypothetical protein